MKRIFLLLLMPFLGLSQVQLGQIIASDVPGDRFGNTLALSSDGRIAVVGVPGLFTNGDYSGQVIVYEYQNDSWIILGEPITGLDASDWLGSLGNNVAISSDGHVIAIGITDDETNGWNTGRIEIYEYQNGIWEQSGQTIYGDANRDYFGYSMSFSEDGNILITGTPTFDNLEGGVSGGNYGQVRVYENQGEIWTQIGQDLNGSVWQENLGVDVDISSDGTIIAIGAMQDSNGTGYVRIYSFQDNVWTQVGEDIIGSIENGRFGSSVSLSSDGSTVAIGAPGSSNYVSAFHNQNDIWTPLGQQIIGLQSGDQFGKSVSISANATRLAIGAPVRHDYQNGYSPFSYVQIYDFIDGNWERIVNNITYPNQSEDFGSSVSLSSDGSTVAIGNPRIGYIPSYNGLGEVQIYDLTIIPELSVDENTALNFVLYPNPANTEFSIRLQDSSILEQVSIYNTLGQKVMTSQETTINTSKLGSGMYLVKIVTNHGQDTKTLIIE